MLELSIRFTSPDDGKDPDSPIQVSLYRPDSGASTAPTVFNAPLNDAILDDLRWYLEVFSNWPTGPDYERATRIEREMENWGHALLESVTQEREAVRLWQQFIDATEREKVITLDATDPRVLRLPWEMLADKGGHLFGRGIGVRRRLREETPIIPDRTFELPVRILVVIARPDDAGFISPRAVSVPLLAALDDLGDRVVTEFLYPPTLTTLTERLNDPSAPPVHVVHFDGHGVYEAEIGLGFLLFEDEGHKSAPVNANQLGTLLYDCNVPLMVLNACQSAKQEVTNPYASIAARLIRSGVGSVLAMNYSVLVVAAHKFVEAFYGGLADGLTVGKAVDKARRALLADPKRHTLTRRNEEGELVEETIRLFDWFLPALYQQAQDPQVFTREGGGLPPTTRILPRVLTDENAPGGLPPEPLHGFHGRAYELLKLERELARRAVVVLHGFGGMGKTALAAEAGRWFYRTGRFPGGAAFVSFEHGGSLQQLCSWVGQAVSGDPDFVLSEGNPVDRVAKLLHEKPSLVILDNFESVLGREPLMPSEELKALLDAVWTWAQAGFQSGTSVTGTWGSRVLITTRDTSFNDARFSPSELCAHFRLEGLAISDALELAASVLDNFGIDQAAVDRQSLTDLMAYLGGHPLSLYLVLPHLREHTSTQLIQQFEELLPGFTQGKALERNESLEVSLEFSLRHLSDETRAALPTLTVFQGACLESQMLQITELDADLWATIRAEMEAAALVTVEAIPSVKSVFLRFHPTLLPYLTRCLPDEHRTSLETRYWQYYCELAKFLYQSDTQSPFLARPVAVRELPNLIHAFDLALKAAETGTVEMLVVMGLLDSISRFLNAFGRWCERDTILARLDHLAVTDAEGRLTKAGFMLRRQRGETLLQRGHVLEAERVFREVLLRLQTGATYQTDYDQALSLWWLGRCLETRGEFKPAIQAYRSALDIFERLSASNEDAKTMLSTVYNHLGSILTKIKEFDAAQEAYDAGLVFSREAGDHRGIASLLTNAGTLALVQNDLTEARRRYTKALDVFRVIGEPQPEAVIWHQLGGVAQAEGKWDEAEYCYRESLKINEQLNNAKDAAKTRNQLGIVAIESGRFKDAERWFLLAIEGFEQTQQIDHAATAASSLAYLYLNQNRLEEARQYAERSVAIKETLDLSSEPWKTYTIMVQIAERQGRREEAAQWRRKAQETFALFPGAAHMMGEFNSLIVAVMRAARGDAESLAFVTGEYPKMEAEGEPWQRAAEAIRRIIAGERDSNTLCASLDYEKAYIILHILAGIAGEDPLPASAPDNGIQGILRNFQLLIAAVVAVAQGNEQAKAQLESEFPAIAEDGWQIVDAIQRIWAGERDPVTLTAGIDGNSAAIVRAILTQLEEGRTASIPPQDETT